MFGTTLTILFLFFSGIFSDGSFEEEKMIKKLQRIFCSWTCCPQYLTFQKIVALFILDAFIDLFITICILVNTGFMAADHYGMSQELREFLEAGNYVNCYLYYFFNVVVIVSNNKRC